MIVENLKKRMENSEIRAFLFSGEGYEQSIWLLNTEDTTELCLSSTIELDDEVYRQNWTLASEIGDDTLLELVEERPSLWKELNYNELFVRCL